MFFKTLSTHGGNFHSHQPHVFRVFHFLFKECGKQWKRLEANAENLEKQLDLLENKGERTEKHDSLYAFLKSPEQVLNSCWKNWRKHGKAQFITAF